MNVDMFKAVIEQLLQKHYGLGLDDTYLGGNDAVVESLVTCNDRPYWVVNALAVEDDLYRTDIEGFYGVPPRTALTEADELAAVMVVQERDAVRSEASIRTVGAYIS